MSQMKLKKNSKKVKKLREKVTGFLGTGAVMHMKPMNGCLAEEAEKAMKRKIPLMKTEKIS